MKNKLYISGVIIAVILIGAGVWMYMNDDVRNSAPIADRFDDKIVYTTDLSADVDVLKAHCKEEGGLFNECGSPCPTHEDMCVSVCAYTCEDL